MRIFPKTRVERVRAVLLAGVPLLAILVLLQLMIPMPGESFEGEIPPLSTHEAESIPNLERTVRALTVEIGDRNHHFHSNLVSAERYLSDQLRLLGYEVARQPFQVDSGEVANLEVELTGTTNADEIIVVGAHYDSRAGTVGADDNASGVAAVLELARLLRDYEPTRTIRLVMFVNEEPPHFQTELMGSLVYARSLSEAGENVIAMISIESIGYFDSRSGSQNYPFPLSLFYPNTGDFIGFVGDLGSRTLVRRVVGAFREHTQVPSEGIAALSFLPGVGWSDHWSFWEFGFPALMVTDTAPFRNPHYHQPTDTIDTLDFDAIARITHGLAAVVLDLDQSGL